MAEHVTRISKKWLLRQGITAAVLIGFGCWGLYDALLAYPARGSNAAAFLEYQYLDALNSERGRLDATASVTAPQDTYERLSARVSQREPLSTSDRSLHAWLQQLSYIGKLDPANTTIPRTDFRAGEAWAKVPQQVNDPESRRDALRAKFTSNADGQLKSPSPLNFYDIPSQWLFVVLGYGIGGYLLFLILKVKATKYRWDDQAQRLTLPGGASFVPSDLAEVDKRKWHKFFVTLRLKPEHAQLGGKDVTLDLLRYEPLEEWVLEMERTAFPEAAAEQAAHEQAKSEPVPEGHAPNP